MAHHVDYPHATSLCKEIVELVEGRRSNVVVDEPRITFVLLDILRFLGTLGLVDRCTNSFLKDHAIRSLKECLTLSDWFREYANDIIFENSVSSSDRTVKDEDIVLLARIKRSEQTQWEGVPSELSRLILTISDLINLNPTCSEEEEFEQSDSSHPLNCLSCKEGVHFEYEPEILELIQSMEDEAETRGACLYDINMQDSEFFEKQLSVLVTMLTYFSFF